MELKPKKYRVVVLYPGGSETTLTVGSKTNCEFSLNTAKKHAKEFTKQWGNLCRVDPV